MSEEIAITTGDECLISICSLTRPVHLKNQNYYGGQKLKDLKLSSIEIEFENGCNKCIIGKLWKAAQCHEIELPTL